MSGGTSPPVRLPGSGETAAVAREAVRRRRDLFAVSRPSTWLMGAIPFLVGALEAERGPSTAVIVGTLYFLAPYGLLRHGIRDLAERPITAGSTALAIAATNVPFLLVLGYLGGPPAALALLVTVGVALLPLLPILASVVEARHAGAAPIARLARPRERAVLELVVGAFGIVLPAICGLLVMGRAPSMPWLLLVAALAWGTATLALGTTRFVGGSALERRAHLGPTLAPGPGAQRAAIVVLAGYGVAILLVALHGPLGVLAAVGLSVFLLLAVMVLVDAGSSRRARADLPGMVALVGAWLTVVLILHWEVPTVGALDLATLGIATLVAISLVNVVLTRLLTRRRHVTPRAQDGPDLSLTIIVPGRDDGAADLPSVLAALRAQTYADARVLVVDDGSPDDPGSDAATWIGDDDVTQAPARPEGWTRTNWIRHVGAQAANTDLILFVDADTVLVPVAARILVEQFEAARADLVSGAPRAAMPTTVERAASPGFELARFGFVPIWWSALAAGRPWPLAFAFESLVLVRRSAYLAAGGHAAHPGSSLGAAALVRSMARMGASIRTAYAADLGATRTHRDMTGALDGWRRLIAPSADDAPTSPAVGSLAQAIVALSIQALTWLGPVVLPIVALAAGVRGTALAVALVPVVLLVVTRVALCVTQRQPLGSIMWHPVTASSALLGGGLGIVDHVRGPSTTDARSGPVRAVHGS